MNDPLVVGYVLPLLVAAIAMFIALAVFFALTASYGSYAEESSQALDRWLELQGLNVLSTTLRGGGPYHKIRVADSLGQTYSGWAQVRPFKGKEPTVVMPLSEGFRIQIEWEGHAPFGVPLKGEIFRHQYQNALDLADEIDKEFKK